MVRRPDFVLEVFDGKVYGIYVGVEVLIGYIVFQGRSRFCGFVNIVSDGNGNVSKLRYLVRI